jgi:hypothetical protein
MKIKCYLYWANMIVLGSTVAILKNGGHFGIFKGYQIAIIALDYN